MFKPPKPKTHLEIEIDKLVLELDTHDATSEKYGTVVERLSKLHKIQEELKPASVDPNTLLAAGANLLGIIMIIHHEHLGVITTKAMTFVRSPR